MLLWKCMQFSVGWLINPYRKIFSWSKNIRTLGCFVSFFSSFLQFSHSPVAQSIPIGAYLKAMSLYLRKMCLFVCFSMVCFSIWFDSYLFAWKLYGRQKSRGCRFVRTPPHHAFSLACIFRRHSIMVRIISTLNWCKRTNNKLIRHYTVYCVRPSWSYLLYYYVTCKTTIARRINYINACEVSLFF